MKSCLVVGLCLLVVVAYGQTAWGSEEDWVSAAQASLRADFPGTQFYGDDAGNARVFGVPMSFGSGPEESADLFRQTYAGALGASMDDLQLGGRLFGGQPTVPLMYDRQLGEYKFTLVYFSQVREGYEVFRSDARFLVRNEVGYPLVLVSSTTRDLGDFSPNGEIAVDEPNIAGAQAAALKAVPGLTQFSEPRLLIFAGVEGEQVAPTMALEFIGDNGAPATGHYQKWLFVADATTGEILFQENQILHVDINGSCSCQATPVPKADICLDEISFPFPYAYVAVQGGSTTYADENGDFFLLHGGSSPVTVESPVRGRYFRVYNQEGADTVLTQVVTPPGPAIFVHNEDNNDEFVRAEVNGYIQSNVVRDFTLYHAPGYPVIGSQTNFTVNVNIGSTCNAFYDGSSINFYRAGGGCANTAYSSVVHHEYGHHLVQVGGSGQGQYGEGMSDCMSMLIADDPILGYGFENNCSSGIRSAVNNLQYPCDGAIHYCGQLLSGCVWDTRNALSITHPNEYMDILAPLTINSILLHGSSSSITPAITIDFLTLDDDDGMIENGTPHYAEICTGFDAHSMDCPALQSVTFVYPNGLPATVQPGAATEIEVIVQPLAGTPQPGTGQIHYSINGGGFVTQDMTEGVPNHYVGTLPAADCFDSIAFYFSVRDMANNLLMDPVDAPTAAFTAVVATSGGVEFEDDFNSHLGWSVQNGGGLSDGAWQRAIPAGGGDRGDPVSDYDGSGYCYVTDNADDNSDVDDGYTWLISPVFDVDGADGVVNYALWYTNDYGGDPNNDLFKTYVSNDGGSTWVTAEVIGPQTPPPGWHVHSFLVSDFVEPTDQVRVRFEASDLNSGSVVEAGIDAFELVVFACDEAPQACCYENGTCAEVPSGECLAANGTPQGADTLCADVECPQPDLRNVVIGMQSSVEPDDLCPGESFSVDVYLSSENGDIDDVRLLQFDTSETAGATVDGFTWDMEALADMSLYLLDDEPEVVRAVYATDVGLPGFIVNLNSTPQKVATVDLTFGGGSGEVNLLGPGGPPGDFSIRFQADFTELNEYTATNGKVQGGVLLLSEGPCDEIMIVDSYPPNGAIDARRPHDPSDAGAREGWAMLTLEFDGDVSGLTPADFATSENGGDGTAPNVASVTPTGPTTVEVALDDIIEPLAWTTLTHVASGTSVMVGFLPGDANQDAYSSSFDTLSLIDHLNAIIVLPEPYATDIDRSGVTDSFDILELINLLNGAGAYDVYNEAELP
jgi:hypothetical protein